MKRKDASLETEPAAKHVWPGRLLVLPELNVVVFGFLLHFVWEMWQIPFYEDMPAKEHWLAVWQCTRATFGDAVIMLIAYWSVAAATRTRRWILDLHRLHVLGFVAIGILITVGMEEISLHLGRWEYAQIMPTLPLLGTGLVPLLQWLVIPPLALWFVRRQLT